MGILVELRTEKEFFEKIQVVKRNMLTKLVSDRLSGNEITSQISDAVLRMRRDENEIEIVRKSLLVAPQEDNAPEDGPQEGINEERRRNPSASPLVWKSGNCCSTPK